MPQREIGGKLIILRAKNGKSGAVTFENAGDTVTLNGHGLKAGDEVSFSGVAPACGVTNGTHYFVVNPTTNTFQLALTKGGAGITITADATGTLVDTFGILGGLRSKSIALNAEEIDVTNHDSNEWKTLLDTSGIRSAAISAGLVYVESDTVIKNLESKFLANEIVPLEIYISDTGSKIEGNFKLTEFTVEGDYNAEGSLSLSASSSGACTVTHV